RQAQDCGWGADGRLGGTWRRVSRTLRRQGDSELPDPAGQLTPQGEGQGSRGGRLGPPRGYRSPARHDPSVRHDRLDRPLLLVVFLLIMFGILMVYSAGQTDVPSAARGAWVRQIVWVGLSIVAAAIAFRMNSRILEWGAPGLYA